MTDDWTSASFRSALQAMVRKRVPAGDADDVVQAALTEAVASNNRPADPEGARKWIWGVARNKIADYHRHARRETAGLDADTRTESLPPSTSESLQAERELLRWAVGELPEGADAHKTFEWLLREGEGEKLEDIAASEQLPAPQVRQRVSRLRKLFRARWAQLAAAGILVFLVYLAARNRRREDDMAHQQPPPRRDRPPQVLEAPEVLVTRERARGLREEGLRACERSEWQQCLARLDEARRLDEAGDTDPRVQTARTRARRAIERPRTSPDASVPVAAPSYEPSNFGLGSSDSTSMGSDPSIGLARRRTNLRALQRASDGLGGSAEPTGATSAVPRAVASAEATSRPMAMPSAVSAPRPRPRGTSDPSTE